MEPVHITPLFLWQTFLLCEMLVLENNGKKSEKSDLSGASPPNCLEREESFGWLFILKYFKMLFSQMKSQVKAQFGCTAGWLNLY